jgi:aerobic-type carbon monoxide dehydrogenase small subunit (CoxS/CutS family)
MIMAAIHLLCSEPHPTTDQIREGLAGNLCRCTGYVKIIAAVERAARMA